MRRPFSNFTGDEVMRLKITTGLFVILSLVFLVLTPEQLNHVLAGEDPGQKSPESVEERRLLYTIKQERTRLRTEYRKREQQLDMREIELKTLAGEVDKKIKELQEVRKDVQGLLAEKDATESKRVKKLSRMYAKMKPAKAADLLAKLEQDLAIGILTGMAPKSGAKIMNNLPPGKATSLSQKYSSLSRD